MVDTEESQHQLKAISKGTEGLCHRGLGTSDVKTPQPHKPSPELPRGPRWIRPGIWSSQPLMYPP
jgi:hypothetical protein